MLPQPTTGSSRRSRDLRFSMRGPVWPWPICRKTAPASGGRWSANVMVYRTLKASPARRMSAGRPLTVTLGAWAGRDGEAPGHVARLVGLQRVADIDLVAPRPVFQAQQSDLAVGLDDDRPAKGEREGLRVGQRIVGDDRAAQRIAQQIGLASGLGGEHRAVLLQAPRRALLRPARVALQPGRQVGPLAVQTPVGNGLLLRARIDAKWLSAGCPKSVVKPASIRSSPPCRRLRQALVLARKR